MAKNYWSFSFSISPSNEYSGLISFRMDWLDLLALQGTLKSLLQHHSSKASILQHSAFFRVQLSYPHMTTGKTKALTRRIFVGKVMSLTNNDGQSRADNMNVLQNREEGWRQREVLQECNSWGWGSFQVPEGEYRCVMTCLPTEARLGMSAGKTRRPMHWTIRTGLKRGKTQNEGNKERLPLRGNNGTER